MALSAKTDNEHKTAELTNKPSADLKYVHSNRFKKGVGDIMKCACSLLKKVGFLLHIILLPPLE